MYLLSFLVFLIIGIKSDIVTIPINEYYYGIFNPSLTFPQENINYSILLNTFNSYSVFWLDFTLIKSHILKDQEKLQLNSMKVCYLYQTDIQFQSVVLKDFFFYVGREALCRNDVGISLGYHIKDETFSIVHSLYNKNIINKLQFAFENPGTKNKAFFHIGGLPLNKQRDFPYKGIIRINETLPSWGFTLDSIKYNDKEYKMNIPCLVHSAMENMFVSEKLFRFLSHTIFNDTTKYQQTSTNIIKQFKAPIKGEIEFKFEEMKLKLNLDVLFNQSESQFVIENKAFHNFSGIFLGSKFLYLFNYSLFDFENKQIEFYSDTIIISNDNNQQLNPILFPLISVNIVLCFIECLVLFYYKIIN